MQKFWQNKKVLLTGCTGFKGSWLTIWLNMLGAKVYAYSLTPPTNPSMWQDMHLENLCQQVLYADIRDYTKLKAYIDEIKPEIIIHMAAQPLVQYSYKFPRETYEVNVMGTVNILEAAREANVKVKSIVNVTTDKCYENQEWIWPYRENEPMGGHDPYSNSKGCSELVTSAYISSFFIANSSTQVASARAGNVIGGGDWAVDRLIPDIIRSFNQSLDVLIRYPNSIRPWQHVLEPLSGYLNLAQKLYENGSQYSGAWNFGPLENSSQSVEYIVTQMCEIWGEDAKWHKDAKEYPHEATFLRLDCSKAQILLNWRPIWGLDTALTKLTSWYKAYFTGSEDMLKLSRTHINQYVEEMKC